jgi:3-oxoacyl-[acyl-carrier protein] reductase
MRLLAAADALQDTNPAQSAAAQQGVPSGATESGEDSRLDTARGSAPGDSRAPRLLVAGGCGGIGRSLVQAALNQGARVAVLDLPASIERHRPPPGVVCLAADAADRDGLSRACQQLGDQWGGLDGAVNLIGFMAAAQPLAQTPSAVWDEVMRGNLDAAHALSAALQPLLARGEGSSLVHVASGLGMVARPNYGPYSIAKAGLIMMTRQLALEWAPAIRVNAVAPSAVDTAFLRGGTGRSDESQPTRFDIAAYGRSIPLGRIAQPYDIVGPILFFLSDAACYVTGQTLQVNGGAFMS